jgi:glycerol-3-phosphate dehydrogenase
VNRYFKEKLRREDVIETFSGVRPLFDDGKGNPSAVTRDYVLDLDEAGGAALLNVFGGKITTYRRLSEHALQKLAKVFPGMGPDWTAHAPLPGGEIDGGDWLLFVDGLRARHPWMPRRLAHHYARLYGARAERILGGATSEAGLGRFFGATLFEAEARYLAAHEWSETADDVLRRRTKHGLHLSPEERDAFVAWWDQEIGRPDTAKAQARDVLGDTPRGTPGTPVAAV